MATLYNRVTHQRVFIWLVTFLGIASAPVLGYFTCTLGWQMDIIIAGLIVVATWAFVARDRWWVPFPAALSLGGTFYFGFKVPVHEIALLICLFPLILALATRWQGAIPGRSHPPPSVFFLASYLVLHWIGSLLYNQMNGLGGAGNVTRSYMNAFWPMILFFTYYFFGNSKYIRTAFFLMYCALCFRVLFVLGSYFFPGFVYIPGINYVPAGASVDGSGIADLRAACPALAGITLCYLCIQKGFFIRTVNFIVLLLCFVLVFMSGGRLGTLSLYLMPIYWACLTRKYLLIILLVVSFGAGFLLLNSNPEIVNYFPDGVQRSLSGFLLKKNMVRINETTGASDEWHAELQKAGFQQWTKSMATFFFGNGIRPFSKELFESTDMQDSLKTAIATGRFESALWTVLSSLGLIGMLLYLNVFRFLLADSLPLLWKQGICDYQTAFAFITSFGIFMFIILGNFVGYYPSTEIIMGLFAKTLHDDQRREAIALEQENPCKRENRG